MGLMVQLVVLMMLLLLRAAIVMMLMVVVVVMVVMMMMVVVAVVVIVVVVGAVSQENVLQDGAARATEVGRSAGHWQAALHLRLVEGFGVLLGDDFVFVHSRQYGAFLEDDRRHRLVQLRADRPAGKLLLLVLRRAVYAFRRLEIAISLGDLDLHLPVFILHRGVILLQNLVAAHRRLGVLAEVQHVVILGVGFTALFGRRQDLVVIAVRVITLV